MDKLDARKTSEVLDEVLRKAYDNRKRFIVSMKRHKECGENRELCIKIVKLRNLLYRKNEELADTITTKIINKYFLHDDIDYHLKKYVCIPYSTSIGSIIDSIVKQCYQFISPLKNSSDDSISELAQSIEEDIENIRDDVGSYIVEPFSISFKGHKYSDTDCWNFVELEIDQDEVDEMNEKDEMDDTIDYDFFSFLEDYKYDDDDEEKNLSAINNNHKVSRYFASDVWKLEKNSALFFYHAFTSNEEHCANLFKLLSRERVLTLCFKSHYYATAMDAYNFARQLPRTFIRVFFRFYEIEDPIKYNQLVSLLELGEEKEFITLFQNNYIDKFMDHYNFLRLALDYYAVFSLQSNTLPNMKEYLVNDFPYVSYSSRMECIGDEYEQMLITDPKQYIPEVTRILHFNDKPYSNNNDISDKQEVIIGNNPESILQSLEIKDIPSYISRNDINKKFDVTKLVEYLTSTNKYTDTIFVEKGNQNENDLSDCLTYFFHPYSETIRRNIQEKKFSPNFQLKWKGRHAVSLKCLVRLLINANEDATTKNVFDSSEDDRLSRKYVSVQDDKSPIWKPVTKVFGKKAIYNAGIDKEASNKTIEANEREIKEIINIVFACKK